MSSYSFSFFLDFHCLHPFYSHRSVGQGSPCWVGWWVLASPQSSSWSALKTVHYSATSHWAAKLRCPSVTVTTTLNKQYNYAFSSFPYPYMFSSAINSSFGDLMLFLFVFLSVRRKHISVFFFSNKTQFECNQTTCPSALKCSQWDIICSLLQCVFGNIYSFWLWSSSHYTICVWSSSFTANNVFPLLHHAAVVLSLELLNWV